MTVFLYSKTGAEGSEQHNILCNKCPQALKFLCCTTNEHVPLSQLLYILTISVMVRWNMFYIFTNLYSFPDNNNLQIYTSY